VTPRSLIYAMAPLVGVAVVTLRSMSSPPPDDGLDVRVASASARADAVAEVYDQAASAFARAAQDFEHAAEAYRSSAVTFEEARSDYALAADLNRMSGTVLFTVASVRFLRSTICTQAMSPAEYRALHHLREGTDVDHALPRSWGGADNALNYQALPSSVNRSLGNDLVRKFIETPDAVVTGTIVSAFAALGGCIVP
jgi:hypothetical protein